MTALERPPGQVLFESLHGAPKEAMRTTAPSAFAGPRLQHQRHGLLAGPRARPSSSSHGRGHGGGARAVGGQRWYVNYMQADEPIERVRAAFGDETFERLRTLKRRYDPNNVLRRNQNIPPGTD